MVVDFRPLGTSGCYVRRVRPPRPDPRAMNPRLTALLAALFLLTVAPSPGTAGPRPGRALWIWEDASPRQVRFASRHGFDRLYVQLVPGEEEGLRRLVRTAHRRGVGAWAMGGRASWAHEPAPMIALARKAARQSGLRGLVLDVEPHALPQWDRPAPRRRLMRSFLRGLERAVRAAGELPVIAAVPFWYDHDGYHIGGRSLLEQVLERVDGVVVMAYRDRAEGRDGIVRLAGDEVRLASRTGKQVMIGVQVSPDEIDKLGFAEEGAEVMERELALVNAAFLAEPGFAGVAVHHYGSFRSLAEGARTDVD